MTGNSLNRLPEKNCKRFFAESVWGIPQYQRFFSLLLSAELYADYLLLTDSEKEIVDDLGLTPPKTDTLPVDLQPDLFAQ